MNTASDRLIVGLDVPNVEEARAVVNDLGDSIRFYKIGLQLFPIGGVDLAKDLIAEGKRVFLDFKFYDIGATVERGVRSATQLGADFLTVHGDTDILRGAVAGRGDSKLKILAVTVLTSMGEENVRDMGYTGSVHDLVLQRAEQAANAGCNGVIASPLEASSIRERFDDDLVVVTPGIRPASASVDDQKRMATPSDALGAGANYLVVARPILNAENRRAAAETILGEMKAALE